MRTHLGGWAYLCALLGGWGVVVLLAVQLFALPLARAALTATATLPPPPTATPTPAPSRLGTMEPVAKLLRWHGFESVGNGCPADVAYLDAKGSCFEYADKWGASALIVVRGPYVCVMRLEQPTYLADERTRELADAYLDLMETMAVPEDGLQALLADSEVDTMAGGLWLFQTWDMRRLTTVVADEGCDL